MYNYSFENFQYSAFCRWFNLLLFHDLVFSRKCSNKFVFHINLVIGVK